jgi:ankyrin repeat protein
MKYLLFWGGLVMSNAYGMNSAPNQTRMVDLYDRLMFATQNHNVEQMKHCWQQLLVHRKKDRFNTYSLGEWSEDTPIIETALKTSDDTVIQCCINFGFNPNQKYAATIGTFLHFAARECESKVVGLLLKYGADYKATNQRGQTALHHAIVCKKIENAKILMQSDTINQADDRGNTALHYAIKLPDEIDPITVITLLLERGALPHIANPTKKETPRDKAYKHGRYDIVELLDTYSKQS